MFALGPVAHEAEALRLGRAVDAAAAVALTRLAAPTAAAPAAVTAAAAAAAAAAARTASAPAAPAATRAFATAHPRVERARARTVWRRQRRHPARVPTAGCERHGKT